MKVRCLLDCPGQGTRDCAVRSRLASYGPHASLCAWPSKWSLSSPTDCSGDLHWGNPPAPANPMPAPGWESRARARTSPEVCPHAWPETPLTCYNTGSVGGLRTHTPRSEPLARKPFIRCCCSRPLHPKAAAVGFPVGHVTRTAWLHELVSTGKFAGQGQMQAGQPPVFRVCTMCTLSMAGLTATLPLPQTPRWSENSERISSKSHPGHVISATA